MNIVQMATSNLNLSTLVKAVQAADLVDALSGEGPLTVFAPSDAAFAKLPKGALDDLLKTENKARLTALLKGHVVPGTHLSAEFAGKQIAIATLDGGDVTIKGGSDHVTVAGARIQSGDIAASNGVIHLIDAVLEPMPAPA